MQRFEEGESFALGLAVLEVVLSVASVISGVYSHFGPVFYVIAVLTILLGFYMAYTISRLGRAPKRKKKA
jgi:uncharacterized membrane protein AbrB (regulator of aidB expression)